jgi:hypothetical protein
MGQFFWPVRLTFGVTRGKYASRANFWPPLLAVVPARQARGVTREGQRRLRSAEAKQDPILGELSGRFQ